MTKYTEEFLLEQLKHYFGFNKFIRLQKDAIQNLLEGNDTFVIMPTGGGKSMCYQLPALMLNGTAIIISPLIALMKNQVDSIRSFGTEPGIAHFLNSSLSKAEIANVKDDVLNKRTKLLFVAPESLTKEENVVFLQDIDISFYAIDEAHCISEWGHDFRPEYRKLRPIIEKIGNAPIIALTATATPKVQQDIQKTLGMMEAKVLKSSFNRANLYYEIRPKVGAVKEIIKYINAHVGKSGIIYCLSRKKVEELAETLQVNGIKALPYHAGMDSSTRSLNQDKFLMEDVDVIVATIAFGMGIDKPDVRFVIHYDIPKSLEGYYQETGRAGRDGGIGECITFYSYDDIEKLEKLLKGKPVAEQEIGKHLLQEVVGYADSSICRRKVLLHYFGEEYKEENCENCDNCNNPQEKFEGKDDIALLLKVISELKEQFKSNHIVNVLTGNGTSTIKTFKHNKLPYFGAGIGDGKNEKFWLSVIRQTMVASFIIKDIEDYGILKLSDTGKAFMKNPVSITLSRHHEINATDDDDDVEASGQKSGGADTVLFAMLKDLRRDLSKKMKVPPFVIFQDTSLEDMTIQYPIKISELNQISGVGSGKASKFGKPFVDLIAKYVEENEIDRPIDMVVKSVVNKSGLKVYLIQNIDRKLTLDDIAKSKGLSFGDLLNELEAIVLSGTKLDISYYTNEVMEEDKQQEIYGYFSETDTDSIEEALKELGEDDFSEEEVRLVRIRFLSEMGN